MLISLISAMGLLFALMAGWIAVQRAAQRFAVAHPEFGPLRLVGAGCGGHGHGEPAPLAEACETCEKGSCAVSAPKS
jgi:hypothetical protein